MARFFLLLVLICFLPQFSGIAAANELEKASQFASGINPSRDWPSWRGPQRNGNASSDQNPPLQWSESDNIIWKTAIPGRGHSSPTIVGNRIFLLTAEQERAVQSVLCFERGSGKSLWQTEVHQGEFNPRGDKANEKSTFANSTVACDGERIFANFLHDGAIYTSALDLNGKQLWQTKITDYLLHQGFASSPAVYQHLVIVSADNKSTGAIAALERTTGKVVWKISRPKLPNYTSPIIFHIADRDQLFFFGCNLITSLDPLTGETIWEIKGSTEECVTSTVTDGKLIYTTGGYPRNHMSAVHADGSGKIAWENTNRVYVPSMLQKDGYLYFMLDAGIAMCLKCDTGEEMWKQRVGGAFTSSPVLVGDNIFATSEAGKTFVFKANPKEFSQVAENHLAEESFATPTICESRIYMRLASTIEGKRQEMLYCIGQK